MASWYVVTSVLLIGILQTDLGSCTYCYTCSHSKDSPSRACINATDQSLARNCSYKFCYTNIEYDKVSLEIVSMLRRCLEKDLGSQCHPPGPKKMVCDETCLDDYCNSNSVLYETSGGSGKMAATIVLYLTLLMCHVL